MFGAGRVQTAWNVSIEASEDFGCTVIADPSVLLSRPIKTATGVTREKLKEIPPREKVGQKV